MEKVKIKLLTNINRPALKIIQAGYFSYLMSKKKKFDSSSNSPQIHNVDL